MDDLLKFLDRVVDFSTMEMCWIWKGSRSWQSYGSFYAGHKSWRAHRWIYQYTRGKLTEGLVIDHLCGNKLCVNPFHLEEVTQAEDMWRTFNG